MDGSKTLCLEDGGDVTPETAIKRQICAYLVSVGAFIFTHDSVGIYDAKKKCFRTNHDPHRIKGVSDILGIWHEKFLAIEVKCPGKYPSKEQREFIKRVNELGGVGFVARCSMDVEANLKEK